MGARLFWTVVGLCASTTTAFAQTPAQPAPPPQPQPSDLAPPLEEPEPETTSVTGPVAEPIATPPPPAPPPEPIVIDRVSRANLGLLLGAGFGLGAGIGLMVAAHGDARDAEAARSYEDYDRLDTRSTRLYIASALSLGAGVALGAIAMIRIQAAKEHNTTVSLSPRNGGGTFVLEGTW